MAARNCQIIYGGRMMIKRIVNRWIRRKTKNLTRINVTCEFDRLKTDKNGSVIYDEAKKDFAKEHIVARI